MSFFNDVLISFFHLDDIGLYLALMLFGIGMVVIAGIVVRYQRIQSSLKQFSNVIQESDGTKNFTAQYETFRQKVLDIPNVEHAWQEFEETLIPPLEDIDDPNYRIYRNTKRPADYFSTSTIHHLQLRPWVQPHTFVGLGLLFTFLGLVAALTETGKAFSSPNVDELQGALQALLLIAGTKFWASVGGLFTSILVGAVISLCSSAIRKRLHIICDMLEKRLLYANHERIAVDQYGHSQRQTRRLEEMSTEITVALGNRISDAIGELPSMLSMSLGETMKPVTEELRNVTQNLNSDNHSALEQMANKFAEQVSGSSGESFKQVNEQLKTLVTTLELTATKLSGGGDELRSGLEGAISNINQTMLGISQQLKDTTAEAGGRFKTDAESAASGLREVIVELKAQQEASVGRMTELTDTLGDMTSNVSSSVKTLIERSGQELGQVVSDTISRTSQTVEQSLGGLGASIEERVLNATASAQNSFTDSFALLHGKLADTSESLTGAIAGWRTQLNDISGRFEAISGQLSNQIGAISDVNQKVVLTGNAFQQSAQSVREATSPLVSATQQLDQGVNRISVLFDSALTETRQASGVFTDNLKVMSASVNALQDAWESNGQHLKNVDVELEQAFRQITNQMSASLEHLGTFATTIDLKFSDSLEKLSGFVLEIRELVEELSEIKSRAAG